MNFNIWVKVRVDAKSVNHKIWVKVKYGYPTQYCHAMVQACTIYDCSSSCSARDMNFNMWLEARVDANIQSR